MRALLYIGAGLAAGVAIGLRLRPPTQARCCQQLEQLVRADVGKRCGPVGWLCEGAGDALGVFSNSSLALDLFGVTR